MILDREGNELKAGDVVLVPCRVQVATGAKHANVILDVLCPGNKPGPHAIQTSLGINSRQCLVAPADIAAGLLDAK